LPTFFNPQGIERRPGSPPPRQRRSAHLWLDPDDREEYRSQEEKGLELFISKVAEEKMRNHTMSMLEERKEAMGLMLGTLHAHEGGEFTLVREVVTTALESSSVRVRFDKNSYERLFASMDDCGFDFIIVGWYHSHPGHGCFMSSTDIDTQRRLFRERYHSALVFDPVNKNVKAFYLKDGEVMNRVFAVYWDEYQNPYQPRTMRVRRSLSNPDRMPPPERGLGLPQPVHEDGDQRVEEQKG